MRVAGCAANQTVGSDYPNHSASSKRQPRIRAQAGYPKTEARRQRIMNENIALGAAP